MTGRTIPTWRADGVDVAHVVGEGYSVHDDLAPFVPLEPVDGADERGLSRSGWADDDDDLSAFHVGGDSSDGVKTVVPFVDVAADDDIVGAVLR